MIRQRAWRHVHRAALSCVLAFVWIVGAAAAQANAPVAPERADVTLDGRALFPVRGTTSFPSEKWAQEIGDRIRAIAADPSIRTDSLHVVEDVDRYRILAGEGSAAS